MPIEHQWMDDAHTLVVITLEGKVTAEDYYAGDARMCAMLDSVDHSVDVICDYSRQYYFGPGYAERVKKMESLFRPNLRSAIFVGTKLSWELFDLYTSTFEAVPFKYTYTETLQEARELIAEIRFEERLIERRPPSPESN